MNDEAKAKMWSSIISQVIIAIGTQKQHQMYKDAAAIRERQIAHVVSKLKTQEKKDSYLRWMAKEQTTLSILQMQKQLHQQKSQTT